MQYRSRGILLLLLLLVTATTPAGLRERQREQFLDAESALRNGDSARFERLKAQLRDYPLYGYLEYWQLRRRLGKAGADEVQDFLERYADQPIGERLRVAWLQRLGKRKDWSTYLRFYQPQESVTLQCYQIRARLQRGDREAALKDALGLWLVGHSQPDACDPAFDQLYASSLITSELLWQRIRLALANQKSSLAGYLARRLSAADRTWVKRWQYAHRRPTAALSKEWAQEDTPLVREILLHAIGRLARYKPEQAWKHWQEIEASHEFDASRRGKILRRIALSAARRNHPRAAEWLAAVPPQQADSEVRQWRVRTALFDQDWERVLHWIDELSPVERNAEVWQYWRARALEADGHGGDAFTLFSQLSGERSYYGFLAADHLERSYRMNDVRIRFDNAELQELERLPGIERARELYLAGKRTEARREWFQATAALPTEKLRLAAILASRWGWHDRAIITAAQARYWTDLKLRFPLPHRDSILANAQRYDLDPALIYGVIRQESAFMEDARSAVGALGLMQLMPATGRQTARALKIRYRGTQSLLRSDHNIRLGSAYLNRLLQRYNGSPVLAAAAYNAGPHRVSRWLPEKTGLSAALWVEHIPFRETRRYVKRVLSYATIFEWRLQRAVTRLSQRMPTIRQRY